MLRWRGCSAKKPGNRLANEAGLEAIDARLRAKYGMLKRVLDLFSALSGRIRERAWIEIEV